MPAVSIGDAVLGAGVAGVVAIVTTAVASHGSVKIARGQQSTSVAQVVIDGLQALVGELRIEMDRRDAVCRRDMDVLLDKIERLETVMRPHLEGTANAGE